MSMSGEARPDWLTYDEAVVAIRSQIRPLDPELCAIDEALGRAAGEIVYSRVDHPPWNGSAMDGFAVRATEVDGASSETPIEMIVSDDIPAGAFPRGPLEPGTIARVMTGAPVPSGATGVIRVEHTLPAADGRIQILDASDAARNIRPMGEDVRVGDEVIAAGAELTPAAIGILALTGHREVRVLKRPVIAVLSTGDELADLDEIDLAVAGERVMNSNSHAVAAQIRSAGAEPRILQIARDRPADIRRRFEEGLECDAIISTGGVSVGDRDFVKAVLDEMGVEQVFWRAKVRPGSPIYAGTLRGKPFWGLPGNPVSAMVTFEIFLRDAIRAMAGHAFSNRWINVTVGEELGVDSPLTHFLRIRLGPALTGPPVAFLTGSQSSGVLSSMNLADGLLMVRPNEGGLGKGDLASVLPLR